MPNSRFALRDISPFLIHGLCTIFASDLCSFFRPLLTPVSTTPFFANLSVHGLHFTGYAPSNNVPRISEWHWRSKGLPKKNTATLGTMPVTLSNTNGFLLKSSHEGKNHEREEAKEERKREREREGKKNRRRRRRRRTMTTLK